MPRRYLRRNSVPGATGPATRPASTQPTSALDLATTAVRRPRPVSAALRLKVFIRYATLPQLRAARLRMGQDTELARAIDKRIEELRSLYGVNEAPYGQISPNWTEDDRLVAQPDLPAEGLRIDPESRRIWEAGESDNAFTGLVHLPRGIIYLLPLKPAKRSVPYPVGGITSARAMPVEHTPVGSRGQAAPDVPGAGAQGPDDDSTVAARIAAGLSRPPTGTASHTQLADIVDVPQEECVGFSVTQGARGQVKNFNWTSRSSNTGHFLRRNMLGTPEGTSQMSRRWAELIMKTLIRAFGDCQAPPHPTTPASSASKPPPPPPPPPPCRPPVPPPPPRPPV
ncbi:hypothetical protein AB0D16_18690 [Streptomyces sp. NPDC048161]|uniref:hypothetical protein n=1 Tax=Streptomyces sp. NPDC048161 TaxID=3160985 RepID=UPI0033FF4BEB